MLSHKPFLLVSLLTVISSSAFPFSGQRSISLEHKPKPSHRHTWLRISKHTFSQTLDHFNYRLESYTTFRQKYYVSSKYWGGANSSAPILAYLRAEAALDMDPTTENGFIIDNAPRLKALVVIIEHRYYGESIPFGSTEKMYGNASLLGCFNSAQPLADYAEILMRIKKELGAELSPVIVVGASYGGRLASWFQLKYPHVALGALASSAPVLQGRSCETNGPR